jgi:hypothetical protein
MTGFVMGRYWSLSNMYQNHDHNSMHSGIEEKREVFVEMKSHMVGEMVASEQYKCCLEKPCTYCIEKTPGHGEGATCSCLEDVVNGVHPCGECIGEILEGHGNRFLAKYFASAISEEVGEEHLETLKEIVFKKYDLSFEEQI